MGHQKEWAKSLLSSTYHIDAIEPDYEPRRAIEARLNDLNSQILMYEFAQPWRSSVPLWLTNTSTPM